MESAEPAQSQPPPSSDGPRPGAPVLRGVITGATAGRAKNRRARLGLALGLGIMLLLCLGGVGVFVSLYDNATAIKRSAPDAVVDSFLRAYLVDRDDSQVALYTCKSGADLSSISKLRADLINREKQFDVKVVVTWGGLVVTGTGDARRNAQTELTIAGTKNGVAQSQHTESWDFGLIQDDGWRVCSVSKAS